MQLRKVVLFVLGLVALVAMIVWFLGPGSAPINP